MGRTDYLLSLQWKNPSDVLSVLLIIGGDVIQKALAQVAGDYVVPVAFSFGWVAYSFSTLISVVGDGRLMPLPDHPVKVINGKSGYCRDNKSWIIGRLLRDHVFPLDDNIGLHVTVFDAVKEDQAGKPAKDRYWASGLVITVVQLGIAVIPWALHKDWGIFVVTVCGSFLAIVTGCLPQWRFEKWACRRKTDKTLIVTGGNGTRYVMVIRGNGIGLDLEDLAAAESPRMRRRGESSGRLTKLEYDEKGVVKKDSEGRPKKKIWEIRGVPVSFLITQAACLTLAALWTAFLITVAGLKENAWYLLGVGGVGMIQNVVVAGARRGKSTTGIHLKEIDSFEKPKVMDALMELEEKYEKVGGSLVKEFFPGDLRPKEKAWWDNKETEYETRVSQA